MYIFSRQTKTQRLLAPVLHIVLGNLICLFYFLYLLCCRTLDRVPTDLESQGIDLARESQGILLVIKENFYISSMFFSSLIVSCLDKSTLLLCVKMSLNNFEFG